MCNKAGGEVKGGITQGLHGFYGSVSRIFVQLFSSASYNVSGSLSGFLECNLLECFPANPAAQMFCSLEANCMKVAALEPWSPGPFFEIEINLLVYFVHLAQNSIVFVAIKLIDVTTDWCRCRLDSNYVDLYLIHSPSSGKNIDSFKAMVELKKQGLIRYKISRFKGFLAR